MGACGPLTAPPASYNRPHTIFMYVYVIKCLEKGKEWDHVIIIELKDRTHQHNMECKCTASMSL